MNPDLWWLAGILEGEGTFTTGLTRGRYVNVSVRVVMTDEDVVRRCLAVAGVGRFYRLRNRYPGRWKDQYGWRVEKLDEAAALMTMIRPLMGKRRQGQIDVCLKAIAENPYDRRHFFGGWNREKTHCPQGHPYSGDQSLRASGEATLQGVRARGKRETQGTPRVFIDPVTGDELTRGEYFSWLAQGIIRRWTFLLILTAGTIAVWVFADPIWHKGATDVWNLIASYLALVIESVVGIAMFSSTRRDAVLLREIRRARDRDADLLREVRQLAESHHELAEEIYDHLLRNER